MISTFRGTALAIVVLTATWLSVAGAAAQVPVLPPPDSTTPTLPPPPPPDPERPVVPDPSNPPSPPDTLRPDGPRTPETPVTPTTPAPTTTVPRSTGDGAIPPAKSVNSAPAKFTLDLSEIDALRRQARGKGPRAAEADYGFDSSLPFQPGAGEDGQAGEEALEMGAESEHIARVRSAGAVAAGLVALVLLGMAVWVLRQARPRPSS